MRKKLLLLNEYLTGANFAKEAQEVLSLIGEANFESPVEKIKEGLLQASLDVLRITSSIDNGNPPINPVAETLEQPRLRPAGPLGTMVETSPAPIVWPSERLLEKHDIKPIKYLAGRDAAGRGEGKLTVEGNIYEVLYNGKRAVAKVVPLSNNEPDVWRKILSLNVSDDHRRHLPEIYEIIEDDHERFSIIIMEVLLPVSGHIGGVLMGRTGRGSSLVNKNDEFLHDIIYRAIDDAIKSHDYKDSLLSRSILENETENLSANIEGGIFRGDFDTESIRGPLEGLISRYIEGADTASAIAVAAQDKINSYTNMSIRPIAKYYSPRSLDHTIDLTRNQETLDRLQQEKDNFVYEDSPEKFLYSEKYMEETKSLYDLLKILKDNGIEWSDLHVNNLMMRPGTRELVLIDVGLYDII